MEIAEIYKSRTDPYNVMELNVCCPPPHYYYNPDGDETPTPESIKTMRIYKTYSLSAEPVANAIVLEQARQAYNDLKLNRDTINGVQFSFNDSTRWQDYITALDYCFEKWPPCFIPYENDIWAMYVNVDTTNRPAPHPY